MVSADETPIRESGLSNGKAERQGKNSDKRSRKPRQKVAAKPDQAVELPEQISAPVAGVESSATEAGSSAIETAPVETASVEPSPAETIPAETAPVDPVPSAEVSPAELSPAPAPVDLQTIGNAVGDYTLKTFEQTSSFFGQLAATRSFSKAVELQTQYARQTFETFVAESEKIHGLHREMARQRWQRLEGLVAGTKTRS